MITCVNSMQNGDSETKRFRRTRSDGSEEVLYIAYAPVLVKNYRALDSSKFHRGVKEDEIIVYSLALVQTEEAALESFQEVEESTRKQVRIAIVILSAAILTAVLAMIYLSNLVAASIVEPMASILETIQNINA